VKRAGAILLFGLMALRIGEAQAGPGSSFEVATVRPSPQGSDPNQGMWSIPSTGSFTAKSVRLSLLLQLAYGINDEQIMGKPAWMETELYDVNAKPEGQIKLTREELKPLLQNLLRQRFHLEAHEETAQQKGYALVVAKGGPKVALTTSNKTPNWRRNVGPGILDGLNWSMAFLAQQLWKPAGLPVVDRTGLTGGYDVKLLFAPDLAGESTLPTLFTAVQETLGLRLEAQKIPVTVLVIDHVEKTPAEN
jgi:uncharacterized protein (TIGR03435 family)